MIDLIKIYFENKEEMEDCVKSRKFRGLHSKYFYNTDTLTYPIRAELDNLKLNVTDKSASIENSIHKYFNSVFGKGVQNYNDFSYCDFIQACKDLEAKLGLSFEGTYLTRFEFGFNIKLDFDPTDFIEDNVLMYNYNAPCYDPKYKRREKIIKFSLREYEIKIYNKSLQYGLKEDDANILRVEVKYKSRRLIQKMGIYNIKDLYNKSVLNNVYNDFMNKIEKIIIVDDYKGSLKMDAKEKDFFIKCTNPNYWIDLRKNYSKNVKNLHKKRFLKLVDKYHLSKKRNYVLEKFKSKFEELMFCSNNYFENQLIA
ncbi:conserved protein of unknown function [Tenacibaculum sp. 190130A14a]|uniref:Uncharacterized protein n=1 Tax=Tenacibaculum polynesiense TaxID=3137857 RepID=A0ABM9PAX0_9FLAO